jgi:hypothetical protein
MIDHASLIWEEKLTSLFQPDILLPTEYLATVRGKAHLEPEKKLMLAVLEDAIQCFQDNVLAQSGRRKRLFEEAEQWILEANSNWVFSFESICEVLGFSPQYVRQGLLRWKEKNLPKLAAAKVREEKRMVG